MKNENIPDGWEKKRFGQILDVFKGKQLDSILLFEEQIGYKVMNGGIKESGYWETYNQSENQVIISEGGNSCGFVNYMKEPFWAGGHCFIVKNIYNFETKFLYYLLKYNEFKIMGLRVGTGLPNIQRKNLISEIFLTYPKSITEQKCISSLLTKLDTAIEQTQALIDKYANIKKGLMHDLFAYGIDENGQIRSEKTHKFKDSPLGRIPVEWDVVELEKVTKSIVDGDHFAPPKSEIGIPFITISNLTKENEIDFKNTMFVPQWYYDSLDPKRKAKINDIIYSVVGTIGIPALVKENKAFVFQRHIAILKPNGTVLPQFLFLTMSSSYVYYQADFAAVGIAQKTISLGALRKIFIKMCDKNEQEKILQMLNPIENLIIEERRNLSNLQSQKQGLMTDLLTGKVRVKEE